MGAEHGADHVAKGGRLSPHHNIRAILRFCLRYDASSQCKIHLQQAEPSQGATRSGPSPGLIEG
eukprot:6667017-Lingulodinium_polyedra.AAC.1